MLPTATPPRPHSVSARSAHDPTRYDPGVPGLETTSWGLIEAAAHGQQGPQAIFAQRYQAFVREVLGSRWRGSPLLVDLDDAVQEVFVECLRQGGGLQRADMDRGKRFRAFLAGIVRNVAMRFEAARSQRNQRTSALPESGVAGHEATVSHQLDRAWMRMILQRAGERFRARCAQDPVKGQMRWDVLRLRFEEGLPIRTIAAQMSASAEVLHGEYRRARRQFRACIEEELAVHGETEVDIDRLWDELLELL